MTDLQLAISFSTVCGRLRIGNDTRAKLLLEAGGIGRIMGYLESCADQPEALIRGLKEEADRQSRRAYPDFWEAVTLADAGYPERLRHISLPPAILFVSGMNIAAINSPAVIAVIGSRRPSAYGIEVTKKLTAAIAARGVPVVSGGARGIDALAHRTALLKGGSSFAVLGNGLGVTYPPEHKALFAEIENSGALITEFTPGTAPRRNYFPARNRILAGLCDAVLVTEASGSSGTLITAGFAGDYGRDVLAVPGSILSGSSRSCHNLIRDGAILVQDTEDIPYLPPAAFHKTIGSQKQAGRMFHPHHQLSSEDLLLLEALENAPRTLTGLAEVSGLERGRVLSLVASLTKRGLIRINRGLYTLRDRSSL